MEQGFLAPRRASPTTLGLVLLAHAAVLTAVILAKGPDILPRGGITQLIPLAPPDEPPPPIPPEPRVKPAKAQAPSRIDVPERVVETPRSDPVEVALLPPTPPLPPLPQGPATAPEPPARVATRTDPMIDGRFARAFQPPYPPALMRAEVEGKAVVRVLIGTDGRVKAVEIVAADDPGFAEATRRQALGSWRFRPATRDGVAVESWKTMTVRFRLEA